MGVTQESSLGKEGQLFRTSTSAAPGRTEELKMQIFAKPPSGKTITVECELDWTVGDLKIKLEDKLDGLLSPEDMSIIYAGKQLVNDDTLEASRITKESTVHVVVILRGGSTDPEVSVYNATEEPVGVTVLYGTKSFRFTKMPYSNKNELSRLFGTFCHLWLKGHHAKVQMETTERGGVLAQFEIELEKPHEPFPAGLPGFRRGQSHRA